RQLVHELRPPALDELGLAAATAQLAERVQTSSDQTSRPLRIEVEAPHLPPLPAAVEVALYRIVQEALTNAWKHAQAERCSVRIICHPAEIQLMVVDDGVGVPIVRTPGVGLNAMRERAEELGGHFAIV